jgi:hypothetical protein
MRRSFKVQLFIRLFLVTAAVIGANRLIAQHFLVQQVSESIHLEMGEALSSCVQKFDDRPQFLTCFKDRNKGDLISNVSDFYVLCQRGHQARGASSEDPCPVIDVDVFWSGPDHRVVNQIDLSKGEPGSSGRWFAARMSGRLDGPEIWIRETDANKIVDQMWALRDRNLIRVVPIIVLMLGLMTLYMMRVIMNPIASIEENMLRLNATNLDQSSRYRAPYREFEKLVDVFEGLRMRLNDGFIKARRFASDASHELRTPLTILRGQAELLIHETPIGSDMQIRARTMSDEVERLIDITEKLLLLSRADAKSLLQQLVDVNFSELVLKLMNDARSFQQNLKITCDIQPDVTWRCDRTLVSQLIQNLYSNAVNYNLPSGWIHVSLKAKDGYLFFTMENPSADAPSDLGARAFDRFYRGDAAHTRHVDGLGLGLSICAEIAQLHGGTLTLKTADAHVVVLSLSAPLRGVQQSATITNQ